MAPNVSLDAVSCVSKAQCVAVGSMPIPPPSQTVVAVIVTITDGVPGPVVEVGSTLGLTSVDCVSTTTCYAAGTDPYAPPGAPYPNTGGVIVTIENGSAADIAGVPVPSYGPGMPGYAYLYGIGCSGTTTCMAVGYAGASGGFAVNLKNGQLGKEGDLLPIREDSVNGIECVQDDWCVINARTEKGRDSAVGFTEKVKIGLRRGLPVIPGPSVANTNLQGGDGHDNHFQFCMVAGSPVRTGPCIVLLVNKGRAVQVPGNDLLDDISVRRRVLVRRRRPEFVRRGDPRADWLGGPDGGALGGGNIDIQRCELCRDRILRRRWYRTDGWCGRQLPSLGLSGTLMPSCGRGRSRSGTARWQSTAKWLPSGRGRRRACLDVRGRLRSDDPDEIAHGKVWIVHVQTPARIGIRVGGESRSMRPGKDHEYVCAGPSSRTLRCTDRRIRPTVSIPPEWRRRGRPRSNCRPPPVSEVGCDTWR